MTPFILYLLKVNIAFAVLYLFYRAAFSRDTFLSLRRSMLLLMYAAALCYPLIDISGWLAGRSAGSGIYYLYSIFLPEVAVGATGGAAAPASAFSWTGIAFGVYLAGVLLMFVRTCIESYKLRLLLKECGRTMIHGIEVRLLPAAKEPFSFLKWIFVYPGAYEENELKEILVHEQAHVLRRHSLDVILAQLVIIFCWFNPFVWLMRSEIRMNHEYEADKRVVRSGFNKKLYQYHLIGLKQSTTLAAANIYNNFSVLPLKNRIKMLNRKQTHGILRSKYLIFLPVLAMLVFFSNCQNHAVQEEEKAPQPALPAVTEEVETTTRQTDDSPVFDVVEKMPEYPGGTQELLKFLMSNIKYPAKAEEGGIEGRVIIQFVVDKDGTVIDPIIVRGVEETLNEEAMRVVKLMPKWIPGQQRGENVRVKYTLPVAFKRNK